MNNDSIAFIGLDTHKENAEVGYSTGMTGFERSLRRSRQLRNENDWERIFVIILQTSLI
ncbi:MAG: hypothetical protein V7739_15150 [Motiliproteus sp.]